MFYTLASKFLIKGSPQSRDFLTVFLAGSVMYVALHWYLHLDEKTGIVEQVRKYLYYAMVVDIITAYTLSVFFASPVEDKDESVEDKSESKKQYTDEEKKAIMAKMQEARRQQARARQLAEQGGALGEAEGVDPRMLQNGGPPPGYDPRMLQNGALPPGYDPRMGPPPGYDPRMMQGQDPRMMERQAQALRQAQITNEDNQEVKDQKPTTAKQTAGKAKPERRIEKESDKQDKRSIFSRSDESRSDTDSSSKSSRHVEDLDKQQVIKTRKPDSDKNRKAATTGKNLRVKGKKSSDKDDSNDKNESVLDDTEIPMFNN